MAIGQELLDRLPQVQTSSLARIGRPGFHPPGDPRRRTAPHAAGPAAIHPEPRMPKIALLLLIAIATSTSAEAREGPDPAPEASEDVLDDVVDALSADETPDFSGDQSGTNPINFTFDARLYNEYLWLNTRGDGIRNVTTFEYRQPLLDGRLQFRTRLRATAVEADVTGNGSDDIESFGLGEIDFRFLTVPYIDMQKRRALAIGLETFLPTGNSAVGSETASLGPQIFGVFFAPFGIPGTLVAPAYQHKFSFYEEGDVTELHQGLLDLFVLWISEDKQIWILGNPQGVLDYRQSVQFGNVDIEFGTMLDRWVDRKGQSIYVRPAFGMGKDRPFDSALEVGYKVIW